MIIRKILTFFILLIFTKVGALGADIAIRIDNPDKILIMNKLAVQQIFTRKITKWSDGTSIIVFTKPLSSIEHRDFTSNILGLTLFNFKKKLETYTYAGKVNSVKEITSDAMMSIKIAQTPGAIGYINYAIITGDRIIIIIDGTSVQ